MQIKVNDNGAVRLGENWKEGDILQMNTGDKPLFILTKKLPKEKQTIEGHVLFDGLEVRPGELIPTYPCYYRAEAFTLFTGTITLSN